MAAQGRTRGKGWLQKGYWGLVQGENFLGNFLLLIIRLYWGGLLVVEGLGKWMNLHAVADYFSSLHLPYPLLTTACVATVEFLGGISLFIGLFSRIFALLLAIVMATAYATAHKEALTHFFTRPSLFVMQDPFLYLYASLVVLCFGPGLFSVDYWLEKRTFGTSL
jgi:putative oxidoreductase